MIDKQNLLKYAIKDMIIVLASTSVITFSLILSKYNILF